MMDAAELMAARRAALDGMAELAGRPGAWPSRLAEAVDLHRYLPSGGPVMPRDVPDDLIRTITDRLIRGGLPGGPGAALVAGLASYFDLVTARAFHTALFGRVWEDFRVRSAEVDQTGCYRIKTTVTADGAIPLERYGSSWSFKRLHIDREVLLFSHLYGPVAGFTGGRVLLVDAWHYLRRHALRFDDAFEWSDEPTEGNKPVLRAEHGRAALADSGADLGALGPDAILFVNNAPGAGILHGVTPVVVTDPERFAREFHRCSAKAVPC
jgi:hypothetical protein